VQLCLLTLAALCVDRVALRSWFCCWTSAPIKARLSVSIVVQFSVTLSKFDVNEVCTQRQFVSKWAPGDALPIRCRGIRIVSFYWWPIVQDTGAPTTHDKRAQCKALIHGHIFSGKSQYISSFLVILVGLRGDRTRNPWVGSRVFYHRAKSPPGPFPVFIAKFWSRSDTPIPTPNQCSSQQWIATSTPDTVPSILCPLLKVFTTAPPKFVQRLMTARAKLAKHRWSSVQDFCVGLADQSVHELASSGVKLWLGVVRAVVNFAGAENCPFLAARKILCSSKLSER